MISALLKWPTRLPLRLRLTLWYTLSLTLILFFFTLFIYTLVSRTLVAQIDSALKLAATQALINVEVVDGRLTFQRSDQNRDTMSRLNDDFMIHLLNQEGAMLDSLSHEDEITLFAGFAEGIDTIYEEDEPWRVYSQTITNGNTTGYLQIAQELEPLNRTLASLQAQLSLGLPLALLLAALGGYFLATRALRPIEDITDTAHAISASDLEQRIHYQGPTDEVGRLAKTFDSMLDRLQAAFAREQRFTSDAAHELRTPLTALKGQIGVALSKKRPPEKYEETLQEMEGQVDRLIRLSNDLLFIARLDQGQFRPQKENIYLYDVLDVVVDQIRPAMEAKEIVLLEDVSKDLVLFGNFDLLLRLFLNLLDNAVKYTPEEGEIAIEASRQGDDIHIAIADTGPGIADEQLSHLFERFYRAEGDRARKQDSSGQGGAGLGLAIANEIARTQGGQLLVNSEIGKGTTFIVILPKGQSSPTSSRGV